MTAYNLEIFKYITIVTILEVDLLSSYRDVTQDERAILKYIIEMEALGKTILLII